jgi:hypothetical protein
MTWHLPMKAPATTTMSHCLWSGKGCYLRGTGVRGDEGNGGDEGDTTEGA